MFYGFSSVKCATSGIFPVSRREKMKLTIFKIRLVTTNRDSPRSDDSCKCKASAMYACATLLFGEFLQDVDGNLTVQITFLFEYELKILHSVLCNLLMTFLLEV